MKPSMSYRRAACVAIAVAAALAGAAGAALGVCGPFTDVSDAVFCPFVLELFTLGITTGTTPTTYDPSSPVTRLAMAAFLSRTVDGVLKRGSRQASLRQFWTTQSSAALGLTSVGSSPIFVESDGLDLWAAQAGDNTVVRVRAPSGNLLATWTGATTPRGVLVAMSRVIVAGSTNPGRLYTLDPGAPAGAVTTVVSNLGNFPVGIAFDGGRVWTANTSGSVSIVTPGLVWTAATVTTGFSSLAGALFDGANVWVTDTSVARLFKLDPSGAILQTVTVGVSPQFPAFDGANIWVPNSGPSTVSVVRASNGAVLATLTGNGLNGPRATAFDGQRVLVTNLTGGSVSLWKAADLSPLGSFPTGSPPDGACSDGVNFWITLPNIDKLARF